MILSFSLVKSRRYSRTALPRGYLKLHDMQENLLQKLLQNWHFVNMPTILLIAIYMIFMEKLGRSGGIRTHDPYTPSIVRYQAALRSGHGHVIPARTRLRNRKFWRVITSINAPR